MIFYHIRYNIYPSQGPPVEKEEWLAFSTKHNEQQLKRLLIDKNGSMVSIILHQVVGKAQYLDRVAISSHLLKRQEQVDISNLSEWRLTRSSRILKQLNDEADKSNDRYRNTEKPFPLL